MGESHEIPSPCYVLDERLFRNNLQTIKSVRDNAGIDVILAFKGFSMWSAFPILKEYINGATASSLHELQLCVEEMGVKGHTYMVAYHPREFDHVLEGSSYLTFNSLSQYNLYWQKVKESKHRVSIGLRVNPEYSEVTTELYNPAAPTSRLGVTIGQMPGALPEGIEGLHFHTLCESDSFTLENTLKAFEKKFGKYLADVKWLNIGGGHLMTKKGYDIHHLVQVLKDFRDKYKISIIMEPGSAFAWEAGFLKTTILDIVENGGVKTAIIDASFTCHMPDCLEMPYKPKIRGALSGNEKGEPYRIGGVSCLAGDYMESYQFPNSLAVGDSIIFEDMIHYTLSLIHI